MRLCLVNLHSERVITELLEGSEGHLDGFDLVDPSDTPAGDMIGPSHLDSVMDKIQF